MSDSAVFAPRITRTIWRAAALLGVLLVEYLALNLILAWFHDKDAILALPGLWSVLMMNANIIIAGVIMAMLAIGLLWRETLAERLAGLSQAPSRISTGWVAAHAAGYLGFFALTAWILANPGFAERASLPLFAAWAVLGLFQVWALARALFGPALPQVALGIAPIALGAGLLSAATVLGANYVIPYWTQLAKPTLHIVISILRFLGNDIQIDWMAAIIDMGQFTVRIDKGCSGIEGMVLILVILVGYLILHRREHRFPQVLAMIPLALALSFIANSIRLVLLLLIGAYIDPHLAMEGFHSLAGWLFFSALSIGIIALTRSIRWMRHESPATAARPAAPADHLTAEITAAFLMPFLVWLGAGLVTGVMTATGDPYYGIRVLAAGATLLWFRKTYARALLPLAEARGNAAFAHLPKVLAALSPWLIAVAVTLMWLAFYPAPDSAAARGVPAYLQDWSTGLFALWLAFRIVGTSVVVPVIEELAFRGYLQRRLISAEVASVPMGRFTLISLLVSAAAFGLMHGNWYAGALAGVAFSLAVYIRGRLTDAMIAHGFCNFLLAVYALGFDRWDLL